MPKVTPKATQFTSLSSFASGLKRDQLQQLAFLCGLHTSGTKSELTELLHLTAARTHLKPPGQERILSIDLGLRNFAYSLITRKKPTARRVILPRSPPPISLHTWRRHEFMPKGSRDDDRRSRAGKAELFSPMAMSSMTLDFVRGTILPLKPTHILIERQRARTGGGSAVQEWTLRVNTLESMLYAVLRTMNVLGGWDGQLCSVSPSRVGPFWLKGDVPVRTDALTEKARLAAVGYEDNKKQKIQLLAAWLEHDGLIVSKGDAAQVTIESFRHKLSKKKSGPRAKTPENLEEYAKLDDLADSILQGMAWLKWTENLSVLSSRPQELLGS